MQFDAMQGDAMQRIPTMRLYRKNPPALSNCHNHIGKYALHKILVKGNISMTAYVRSLPMNKPNAFLTPNKYIHTSYSLSFRYRLVLCAYMHQSSQLYYTHNTTCTPIAHDHNREYL